MISLNSDPTIGTGLLYYIIPIIFCFIFSYSSTTNGCVLEIEYETFALKRVWQLFPDIPGGVAITSLALHEGFYVTGSADGFVRLWPVDFEHVTMETGINGTHNYTKLILCILDHDSPVIAVGVARDGLQILTATNVCLTL